VTIAPQSGSSELGSSKSVENLLSQDAAALEAILRTDDLPIANSTWSPFLPFLSWLVSLLNPELTVDLGFEADSPFHAVWRAAQRLESPSKCIVVLLAQARQSEQERRSAEQRFNAVIAQSALRFGGTLEGAVEPEGPVDEGGAATSGFPPIHLLHLGLSHEEGRAPSYLQKWIGRMAPGGVLVIPNTRSTASSEFAEARRYVADRVPSTVIRFGPSSEILVAQVPRNGATPLVDLLDEAPPAFRGLFALFAERSEFRHVLGPEPVSPSALSAFITSLHESRQTERETFQIALNATRETMATLAKESGGLRAELAEFKEQASLEKAAMLDEYFGRLDELTAKLSTSAARYTRELTIRELALEAREREAEMLAGEAAEAQRRVAELMHSSSWRITAPVRLLSRLIGSGRARDASPPRG
jgi:hypothetical protein